MLKPFLTWRLDGGVVGGMQALPKVLYPDHELGLLTALKDLFEAWHLEFVNRRLTVPSLEPDAMVCDGFYPHYSTQRERILFVGRESRGLSGCHYIDVLLEAYRRGKVGNQPLNRSKFHARMLRMAWGMLHGFPSWHDVPSASQIARTFATSEGVSFAFMNLSKMSNETAHWSSDWRAIQSSSAVSTQRRNFIEEQVALLQPTIVVAMNLHAFLPMLGKVVNVEVGPKVSLHELRSAGHPCKLLCTWHFSAPRKKADADYYQPVRDLLLRHPPLGLRLPCGPALFQGRSSNPQ